MWLGSAFTLLLSSILTQQQNVTLPKKMVTVGIIAAENVLPESIAWSLTGGAIGLALDKAKEEQNLNGFDFRFLVGYSECDLARTLGLGIEYMSRQHADVVIGPPCPQAGLIMAHLSNIYGTAWLGWGYIMNPEFSLTNKYPFITVLSPPSNTIGACALQVIAEFKWNIISIIYTSNEVRFCDDIIDSLMTSISDPFIIFTPTVAVKQSVDVKNNESYTRVLQQIKSRSRIVVLCMDLASDRRNFLLRATEMGMANNEYVFLMLGMRSNGFGRSGTGRETLSNGLTPFWEDTKIDNPDGLDSIAKSAAQYMIVVDVNSDGVNQSYITYFKNNLLPRIRTDPLYCKTPECLSNGNKMGANFARNLHDTFYAYGLGLARESVYYHDAANITNAMNSDFVGLTGQIKMTANNTRVAEYNLYYLDANSKQQVYMRMLYQDDNVNVTMLSSDESQSIWSVRKGIRPPATPLCGFSGMDCPKEFIKEYAVYFGVGIALIIIFIVTAACLVIHFFRERYLAQQREMDEWKLAYNRITLVTKESEKKGRSYRSLQSGPSTITSNSVFDSEDSIFQVALLDRDPALITKHPPTMLSNAFYNDCLKLRKLDHDNINKFLGFSFDGLDYVVVWKMCTRGSLLALLSRSAISSDSFFVQCIIRDVAEGLNYIHHSFIGSHGRLTSACCLVTDAFQIKVCDYGMSELTRVMETRHKLWSAPEVLNSVASPNTKEGDVFSFSIIAAETLSRKPAWLLYGESIHVDGEGFSAFWTFRFSPGINEGMNS